MTEQHYVANLKIERVNRRVNRDSGSVSHGSTSRDVVEAVNLTFKSTTIEGLRAKVNGHMALVDEEDI